MGPDGMTRFGIYLMSVTCCSECMILFTHQRISQSVPAPSSLSSSLPPGVRSRPFLGSISRPHPLWHPRTLFRCRGRRPWTVSGVGGIPHGHEARRLRHLWPRVGHIMGLSTSQGAMERFWRVVGVVARTFGRVGTKNSGFTFNLVL